MRSGDTAQHDESNDAPSGKTNGDFVMASKSERVTQSTKLIAALKSGPMTRAQIAKKLGIGNDTVPLYVWNARQAGAKIQNSRVKTAGGTFRKYALAA